MQTLDFWRNFQILCDFRQVDINNINQGSYSTEMELGGGLLKK